jgi:hypothetical protein
MGHQINWDNEDKTVVLQVYSDNPSKEDLYNLAKKSAQMLATVAHTVHLILDERHVNLVFNAEDMIFLQKQTPKNQGAVIMLVDPCTIQYKTAVHKLAQTLSLSSFKEPYFVDSVEGARKILQQKFGVRYPSEAIR